MPTCFWGFRTIIDLLGCIHILFVVFLSVSLVVGSFQLTQAQTGKFNAHVHVEYEWCLQNEDLDESEDELEDKVGSFLRKHFITM